MKARKTLTNLVAFILIAAPLSYVISKMTFHLLEHFSLLLLLCLLASAAYPICVRAARVDIGYMRELSILVLALVIAFSVSEVVYYRKMEPLHHDFGESLPVLVFVFVVSAGLAVLSFSVSYWGSRLIFSSRPKS